MQFRKLALSAAATVLVATGIAAASTHQASASSGTCSANACEYVTNAYQGSNFVESVQVWGNTTATHVVRILFDGTPVFAANVPAYPGIIVTYDAYIAPNTCIQGGIEGVANARTPCWVVP